MTQALYNPIGDPAFSKPYIDIDEQRERPIAHRYLHGGFEGTDLKFSLYFPPGEKYENRFYHFMAAAHGSENASQNTRDDTDMISFAIEHGGYFVESNMGGAAANGEVLLKSNAAVAVESRAQAARVYGDDARPYGYVFGGSGGSLKTCACIEGTQGVWDGAVPFVIASPMAIPSAFTVRAHAMRILRNKIPQIIDATEPGGSGDIYAGLNDEEKEALLEVTRMGFPPRSWFAHYFIGDGALPLLTPAVSTSDPEYYEDFWTQPGYLGAVEGGSAQRDRVQFTTTLKAINLPDIIPKEQFMRTGVDDAWHIFDRMDHFTAPPTLELADVPQGDPYLHGANVLFIDGAAAGQRLPLGKLEGNILTIGESFMPGLHRLLSSLKAGDAITLDNSDYIALQTFHRHQTPQGDFAGWRQFKDESGKPIYPQRPLIGPPMSYHGSGKVMDGHFTGKVIVLASLMDESAFPWFADWYRNEVEKYFGDAADDNFRLWYMDHAMHAETEGVQAKLHVVGYIGALYQALTDLAQWVEKGVAPTATMNYIERDGQIVIPESANARGGVQPVATLTANGSECATIKAGQSVALKGSVAVPNATGKVTIAEWDFEEQGDFAVKGEIRYTSDDRAAAEVAATHRYEKPGVYFPALRVASSRDEGDRFTQIRNIARARVIVTE